jgi:hypothetical protein
MSTWRASAAFLVVLFISTAGRADIPPPNWAGCTGKKLAQECTTDDHASGQCKETPWTGAGPAGQPGDPPRPREMTLVCERTPSLLDNVPIDALLTSFGVACVVVGAGLFLVMRRRKRSG